MSALYAPISHPTSTWFSHASPDTIIQFHDQLSNELPTLKGKWGFSFKVFRNNPYSMVKGKSESKFLHTLSLSYMPETCITLVNKKTCAIFTNSVIQDDSTTSSNGLGFPESYLYRGVTMGYNDSFDYFVNQKLQSLWLQKQNIKGDGGQIYELENGNVMIRTANVFLHGVFKGLLIEINTNKDIDTVITKYNIPKGNISKQMIDDKIADEYGDLCLQFAQVLNF